MTSTTVPVRRMVVLTGIVQSGVGVWLWIAGPSAHVVGVPAGRIVAGALFGVSATFLLSAALAPRLAARLFRGWTAAAHTVGVTVTLILFAVVFAGLLPFALIVRHNDPLRKRLGGTTYWEPAARHETSLGRALQQY